MGGSEGHSSKRHLWVLRPTGSSCSWTRIPVEALAACHKHYEFAWSRPISQRYSHGPAQWLEIDQMRLGDRHALDSLKKRAHFPPGPLTRGMDEFLKGCLRYRGGATGVDMHTCLRLVPWLAKVGRGDASSAAGSSPVHATMLSAVCGFYPAATVQEVRFLRTRGPWSVAIEVGRWCFMPSGKLHRPANLRGVILQS